MNDHPAATASTGPHVPARLHAGPLDLAAELPLTADEAAYVEAARARNTLRGYRFALQYAGVGGVTIERAAALEEAAAARVVARLRLEVSEPTIGRCRSCGRTCAPWFPLCERCFRRA